MVRERHHKDLAPDHLTNVSRTLITDGPESASGTPAPTLSLCKIAFRGQETFSLRSQGQRQDGGCFRQGKQPRQAVAGAFVALTPAVLGALPKNPKGDPLEVARLAGIMAAKRTSDLIPMCHPLPLSHVDVTMRLCENGVAIGSKVITTAVTGVEMEALVAASVAALTVYDMCKALDKGIEIREIVLEHKSGGKSGDYTRIRKKT